MAVQTITATNVRFGACQVTFGGTDLGSFKGGVRLRYNFGVVKSRPDSLGTANNAWMTGEEVVVTVPMLETVISMLRYILPTGVYSTDATKKKITIGGTQIASGDFQTLIIIPITDGSATLDTDANNKVTVWKTLCMGPVEETYNMENEKVVTVEFHGFTDTTRAAGDQLMTFGDTSF